nr:hypothetical protein [Actinomycetota bacterium]NIU22321.1 hypothetical protein [Actinomycetota bacterium]NIU70909.1 hypothetical protein [Actinomycetota bacterium]NIV58889.1 hypothetical protein [Actinomycetota bacterium]NIV90466.1 hypothetical protein [Actinomycetota bacterium]
DGDGSDRIACGGDDCDDDDADRYPGNPEVCDAAGRDEDCNPVTVGAIDRDGDGFVDAQCRNEGGSAGTDCDDRDPRVGPLRTEQCNGRDDDCDGEADEGVAIDGFVDMDADGRGDSSRAVRACGDAARFAAVGEDCDDADPEVHPAPTELCDGKDNDCDGTTDENAGNVYWYVDADGDGYGEIDGDPQPSCEPIAGRSILPTDCNDGDASVSPAATEVCNGVDDDCNGIADFVGPGGDLEDDDRDGVPDVSCGGTDCDDQDPFAAPGFPELCNERDDDCDGMVDEGVTESDWYVDRDGDGYGDGAPMTLCALGSGFVPRAGDCDDSDAGVAPGALEACDGIDQDCDGSIDEGASARCGGGSNARWACVGGRCQVAGCLPGFGDCDLLDSTGCETALESSTDHCGLCLASCAGTCADGVCSTAPAPWPVSVVAFDETIEPFGDYVGIAGGRIATLTMSPTREWLTDDSGLTNIALPGHTWIVASGPGLYPVATEANATRPASTLFWASFGEEPVIFPIPLSALAALGSQRPSRGMVAVRDTGPGIIAGYDQPITLGMPFGDASGGSYQYGDNFTLGSAPVFREGQDLVVFGDVAPGPIVIDSPGCRVRSVDPVAYAGVLTGVLVECNDTPAEF